jgi:hypothetical protein
LLKSWVEGNGGDGRLAWHNGEVTWQYARYDSLLWQLGGARGSSDMAPPESSAVVSDQTLNTWVEWDVTEMVREWASNPAGNCGLKLAQDPAIGAPSVPWVGGFAAFYSRNYGTNPDLRPMLVILTGDPLAAPSGLTATAISPTQINLSWTDNSNNELGFKIERRVGYVGPWAEVATVGADVTSWSDDTLTPGTTAYYRVRAYTQADLSSYSNEAAAVSGVSDGWENAPITWTDSVTIGAGLLGRADWFSCNNSYLLWGNGLDVWNTADEFHYLYAYVLGDFSITATVGILPPSTNMWSKAGLMLRANPTAGSPFVHIVETDNSSGGGNAGLMFQWRDVQNGSASWDSAIGLAGNTDAARLTMTRTGNVVTVGYDNLEGNSVVSWQNRVPPNINPAVANLVGLALTSHQRGALARARFWDVSLTGNVVVPPVAADAAVTTDEDTPVSITLSASDAEGDPLTYGVVTPPAHGTLTGAAPNLTYSPAANYNGADSFTFQANDGQADSNLATISITVSPVNDPPVAAADAYSTDQDTMLTVGVAAGVLANDSDVDGDPLTAALVNPTAHGALSLNGNGSWAHLDTVLGFGQVECPK